MPPILNDDYHVFIRPRRIITGILIVLLLCHRGRIKECISDIYWGVYDSLEPIRSSPVEHRYVATLAVLGLLFFAIYRLLYERMRKR